MTVPRLVSLLLLVGAALAARLVFLSHPIQGDDYYYLASAMYGQTDPLHPHHAHYVFQGKDVDMRGHPHPPLNAWLLTGILALTGELREATLHGFYLLLSLLAVGSMWALARRESPHPVLATALVVASPAFLVSGNSLESDLPLFAFWLGGVAAFVYRKTWLAVPLLACAGLAAYQAVTLVPILWLYLWLKQRDWRAGWILACTPALVLIVWTIFERVTGGAFPVAVAAGYFSEYGLQRLSAKLRNAAALSGHLFFVVGPLLTGAMVGTLWKYRRRFDSTHWFLVGWLGIFFAAALVLFFAGSARYLLPLLPAAALLTTRVLAGRTRLLAAGVALQALVGAALAVANYQHWKGYQEFVARHQGEFANRRVWVNGEWGLRYYAEALGGLPLRLGQAVQPGDLVLSSQLAYPIPYTTGGGTLTPFAQTAITPSMPLRLVGLTARSAWSTASMGLLPFDISRDPVDVVRADIVVEKQPTLSFLAMGDPAAESHLVSGIYQLESGKFRWMGEQGSVFLKANGEVAPLEVKLYIPDAAPAREVTVEVDGREVGRQRYAGAGLYDLKTAPVHWPRNRALVTVKVDQAFVAQGDTRRLGMILQEIGFRVAR
ncbi:MAG: glycosyltransferase family 39 protein [Bryobacteraceae bacterium]|nr:glycosyltransferase family 39 protein [Bryobacteraceae bacterium]